MPASTIFRHEAILAGSLAALRPRNVGFWALTSVLSVFVCLPLALLIINSFRVVGAGEVEFSLSDLTLRNYIAAYSNPRTFATLFNSLVFALGSTAVALSWGGILAFFYERTDLRFKHIIPFMVVVPLIMPSVVKGIAWIFLLSPRIGLLNQLWLGLGLGQPWFNAYSLTAMIWVEGISMSTLAFLLMGAVLRQMDPALEEAGMGCGASVGTVIRRVTCPLLMPGLAGVVLLLFVRGVEAFEIPMLLGLSSGIFVFSTNIYYALRSAFPPDYGFGFTYSMTLVVLTLGALLIYRKRMRRSELYNVVAGKGYRPRTVSLGSWRYIAWAFMAFYGVVGVLLPLLILIWSSLLPLYQPPSVRALTKVSLLNYANLLYDADLWLATKNTVILAFTSSVIIMFTSLLISWFVHRTDIKARQVLDFIVFIPYAVSGVVVGVAFMILFLTFENPIYNTIWIIVLAYVVNYLPIGSRFTHAAFVQLHKELEEAAWGSGAGFWVTLWRIWVPLLAPALVNGCVYLAILSFKVMSIAALLHGPDSLVLSVYLWRVWDAGNPGEASALSVVLIVALGLLSLGAQKLSHARTEGLY